MTDPSRSSNKSDGLAIRLKVTRGNRGVQCCCVVEDPQYSSKLKFCSRQDCIVPHLLTYHIPSESESPETTSYASDVTNSLLDELAQKW